MSLAFMGIIRSFRWFRKRYVVLRWFLWVTEQAPDHNFGGGEKTNGNLQLLYAQDFVMLTDIHVWGLMKYQKKEEVITFLIITQKHDQMYLNVFKCNCKKYCCQYKRTHPFYKISYGWYFVQSPTEPEISSCPSTGGHTNRGKRSLVANYNFLLRSIYFNFGQTT